MEGEGQDVDELVYLFELDSVRNSTEEIRRAQRALFRETVLKGNRVVLSFNQLTDSEGFLWAVRDPESYRTMLSLFSMGVLKYSRFLPGGGRQIPPDQLAEQLKACRKAYPDLFQQSVLKEYGVLPDDAPQRTVRTGSHYVQDALERCLSAAPGKFLFSALPFRSDNKTMLSAVHYALQYSDPSILEEVGSAAADPVRDGVGEQADKLRDARLDFVRNYVELLLYLSREPLAYNPAEPGNHTRMSEYLTWVRERCRNGPPPAGFALWPLLCRGAEVIGAHWQQVAEKKIDNRSDWYDALLQAEEDPRALSMAEAIVDLCYNYAIADSIRDLSHKCGDMEEFWADFLEKLPPYWADGERGIHKFLKPDRTAPASLPAAQAMPRWGTAVRVLRHVPQQRKGRTGKTWRGCLNASLGFQICSAAAYIALFAAISLALEGVEELFLMMGQQIAFPSGLLLLVKLLLFGAAGSWISARFGLLDILDSFKQAFSALGDRLVLWRAGRAD